MLVFMFLMFFYCFFIVFYISFTNGLVPGCGAAEPPCCVGGLWKLTVAAE